VWGIGMLTGTGGTSTAAGWATQIAAMTPGCGTATIGSGPGPNNTVQFTAGSVGCANPEYQFYLRYPNGTWVVGRSFSGNPQWNWDTTGYPLGTYTVHVWANEIGDSRQSWEAFGETFFTLSPAPACTAAGVTPTTQSQLVGSVVGLGATSGSCPAPMYEYFYQPPGGAWTIGRPFNADPNWTWNTAGLVPGIYQVHVWANQHGHPTATYETYAPATVTLTGACTSAGMGPPFRLPAGTTVVLNAGSGGCPNPQYEFWVGYPNGSWLMQRGWGGTTFNWDTTGLAQGVYSIHVWANQIGASTATWEANGSTTITLSSGACTSVSLSPTNPSQAAGTTVTLTASSSVCPKPQYEFWVQYLNGTWHLIKTWGDMTFNWNTTGLAPGTYNVHVWANNIGDSTATWEAYTSDTVTLT
jgi:hypothetical protein